VRQAEKRIPMSRDEVLKRKLVVRLSENESRQVGTKFEELVELSNPDISGLGIIPEA